MLSPNDYKTQISIYVYATNNIMAIVQQIIKFFFYKQKYFHNDSIYSYHVSVLRLIVTTLDVT